MPHPGAVAAASPCICKISARSELRCAALTSARSRHGPRHPGRGRARIPPSWTTGARVRHPEVLGRPPLFHRAHCALYHDTNLILSASRSKTSARQSSWTEISPCIVPSPWPSTPSRWAPASRHAAPRSNRTPARLTTDRIQLANGRSMPQIHLGVYLTDGRECTQAVLWALEVRTPHSPLLPRNPPSAFSPASSWPCGRHAILSARRPAMAHAYSPRWGADENLAGGSWLARMLAPAYSLLPNHRPEKPQFP